MNAVTSKKRGNAHLHPSDGRIAEAALLASARNRDVRAFEELVRRTEDKLYRLAMRHVHNESDAQEILQNVYLSAWRSLPTFEGRSTFGSWMHRITINASLMFLRIRDRHPEVAINDVDATELNDAIGQAAQKPRTRENWVYRPDEQYQSAELRSRIESAVNALPPVLRSIFLLREVGEMSTEDTAGRLGVTIPTAKTRLHRARKALRASLSSYLVC
jgi:RNA polymerase sigma-70 factor (ECF subfamily)